MTNHVHKYHLEGLTCSNCALKIENNLKSKNMSNVNVNFVTRTLTVASNDLNKIKEVVSHVEPKIEVVPLSKSQMNQELGIIEWMPLIPVIISIILLFSGIILVQEPISNTKSFYGYLILLFAYLIAGWRVLWRALFQLKNIDFTNEYFLMSIATLGAILIHEIPEAVAVMVFYSVGEFLQNKAVNHSRASISSLLDIRPDQAQLVKNEKIVTVPTKEINPDDIILIRPGERVPLDGEIIKGKTTLDMSALTGESKPIHVEPGMDVISGSITSNSIQIRVKTTYQESTVSRILEVVENATHKKSRKELFIRRFARYYTPFILVMAIFLAIIPPLLFQQPFDEWLYRALVILVISCPCALVVSIPLVYFSGIGKSSREGFLLKGANVIDSLNNVSTVLWDKTGTLTIGKFQVVTIVPEEDYSPQEVLANAALAEAHSNHPIAVSIRKAYGHPLDMSKIEEYEEFPALGIKMKTINNDVIIVGNDKMVHEAECLHSKCIDEETVVYVIKNDRTLGYIIIDDQIRKNSHQAIKQLKTQSVSYIGLLTGDTRNVAERVGKEVGINPDRIFASLMPLTKLEILEKHLYENKVKGSVVFVGDGINDAPVIARADVGVAMGGIGSDASIEAADLVIMDDNPAKLVDAIVISKKTDKIAKQNITMAIGIKAIFIFLGVLGLANMWIAVFGDIGVAILTILNSLRLLR